MMRKSLFFALGLPVFAASALAQTSPERADDDLPARRDTGIEKTMQDAERQRAADRTDQNTIISTPEARLALHEAAACLAQSSSNEARDLLKMDFRSKQYRTKMDRLFDNNRPCLRGVRYLRSNRLLVAGDLAEHLFASAPQKLNVRLAAIPTDKPSKPRTDMDRVAMCVARSDPDNVARLFGTGVATASETTASGLLTPALNACNSTGKAISVSPSGLRAMLATASFRLIEGQDG